MIESFGYLEDELPKIRKELELHDDTWLRAQKLWNNISIIFLEDLYNSMPNHMKELKKREGHCIFYLDYIRYNLKNQPM